MLILTYDLGTTAVKTSLYEHHNGEFHLIDAAVEEYGLTVLPNGGVEQDPDEWWEKVCISTTALAQKNPEQMAKVEGISFCAQMQALVLVDKEMNALRPSMSYMDQRGVVQQREVFDHGIKIAGMNAATLLRSLSHTGVASASAKDPVWKYLWVKANEPDVFQKIYKWLDVKEYIAARMTGECVRSEDSAFSTLLVDKKSDGRAWSEAECEMLGVDISHLPEIVESTAVVGKLREQQAAELGLNPGIPVFAGGGDASLIGVGAGAGMLGATHVYWGTSGWVGTTINKPVVDLQTMIAAVTGAEHGLYNYFAELETAGKCFQWVRDHLAADEINMYVDQGTVADDPETAYGSMYDYMSEVVDAVPAGSGGAIFAPWLHGNRSPFEDPFVRGMFFNLGIETGKSELIRSVLEGVCMHLRWLLESSERKVPASKVVRFAGGGALSPVTAQILADVFGRPVETMDSPQNVGGVGAAMLVTVGLGAYSTIAEASSQIRADHRYEPNPANRAIYDRNFKIFKMLYGANRKIYKIMNEADDGGAGGSQLDMTAAAEATIDGA
ncbi:MAG: FGGY-family carbohydrate kinase [Arcanobacterium sp.]|nr:FGGY-family carbohydrate kinase [Arcanobacterium sp.]MDY5589330.1 FGGY-family carbohydrate kinase [Arcanobacterium sp.]